MKIQQTRVNIQKKEAFLTVSEKLYAGYVLLEIIIALGLFSVVAVSLVKALHMTSQTASLIQDELKIERILHSAMIDALSDPNLEEGSKVKDLSEITGDETSFDRAQIETIVEPLELENEKGDSLKKMFKVKVIFRWQTDDGWQQQSSETWYYGKLYKP